LGAIKSKVHETESFRDRYQVFKDRFEAGEELSRMLAPRYEDMERGLVLAIPSGGVPVGLRVAEKLNVPFDLIIVRKMQIPGNPEAGFGAMTLDGSMFFNEELLERLKLNPSQLQAQENIVKRELDERNRLFREDRAPADVMGKRVLLVDDGLASGYTMIASINMVKKGGAGRVVVAVPTAPLRTVEKIEAEVDEIYCANIRDTLYFAVAEAYRHWHDLSKQEVLDLLGIG
jgi:predicted phosphoribosyltransferase